MRGTILSVDEEGGTGVISGDDGNRYSFTAEDWKVNDGPPKTGQSVDFVMDGETARDVFPVQAGGTAVTYQKSRIVAALLAFFLGGLGVHKFYYGAKTPGIIMLVLYLGGFFLFAVPSIVVGLIAFVEFIIYLIKSDEEFDRIYTKGQRGWF